MPLDMTFGYIPLRSTAACRTLGQFPAPIWSTIGPQKNMKKNSTHCHTGCLLPNILIACQSDSKEALQNKTSASFQQIEVPIDKKRVQESGLHAG